MLCAAAFGAAQPKVLHVSTKGADFATIEQARGAIRKMQPLKQPVTVYVHGGIYPLSAPIRFTEEDSGTADCPITYEAWQKDKPVFSGGRAITGWKAVTVDGKHLWAAEVPGLNFRQLWINGRRAIRARNPNTGFLRVSGIPDLNLKKEYQIGNISFEYKPGEVAHWQDFEDAEAVFLTFWISTRRHIASLDEEKHVATLRKPTPMRLTDGFGKEPARYYMENAFELLDAPGEFYLRRKSGTLYYMPRPGEQIAKIEAIAPAIDQLLIQEGKPLADKHVQYLTFRGLSFEHAEFDPPDESRGFLYERQASAPMPGAVRIYGARHCSLERCRIAHVSSNAIHFSRGCDHDRLADSELVDLGTGGIKLGEPDRIGNVPPGIKNPFPDDPKLETHDIEITGNDIREGSRIYHQGHGILVGQSYNNRIAHNHIHDFYQIGISVGWTWGYGKSLAHHNIIEYNHIHQIGQGWSSDLAGIYTLGPQPGTVLRDNLIHDVECAEYIGRGIYLDEGSSDIVVENNIIYNTTTGAFGMNYGKRNTIRNNVFAFGKRSQIEPHGNMQKAPPVSSYVLEHNIFLLKPGDIVELPQWVGRPSDELVMRSNLFWQEGGGEIQFGAWKLDAASKVADPKFVDPAKGDFRLKQGSPASEIGFQPIELN
jgi:hypothetical protein